LRRSLMRLPTWMSIGFGFFLFSSVIFSSPNFSGFFYFFPLKRSRSHLPQQTPLTDFEKILGITV
jgi:hypothetical protein